MNQGLINGVLFLDLKKAFHTANHSVLLLKNRVLWNKRHYSQMVPIVSKRKATNMQN